MLSVAAETNLSKADSTKAINAVIKAFVNALKRREKVQIVGFGTLQVWKVVKRSGVEFNEARFEPSADFLQQCLPTSPPPTVNIKATDKNGASSDGPVQIYTNTASTLSWTSTNATSCNAKTKTSSRKIDIGPTVTTELKKWKLACPKNEIDLILPNEAGQPMHYSNMMRRYFEPALTAANVPRIRFHDLRHTYASLLIEQGENVKYIQSQLGHSSPMVTLNVYAHLMKSVNQEATRKLQDKNFSTGHNLGTKQKEATDLNP
jgi:hypothetical protein